MGLRIGIVGATGAVGQEALQLLELGALSIAEIRLFASVRSAGRVRSFRRETVRIEEISAERLAGLDYVFFSAGASISRQYAPAAVKGGAIVIDNSSAFRMAREIPLVVPEVNAKELGRHPGIIANPNCTAAILATAVWPLHQAAIVERIVVATYQAASGAGAKALAELDAQVRQYAAGEEIRRKVFPEQIAFNVFSHNTPVDDSGFNEEENKVAQEIRKIFGEPTLGVCATCIRVPVFRAHSEAVVLETRRKLSAEEAREILSHAPGVAVVDDRKANRFPTPLEAAGKREVLVGRLREDPSHPRALALFVSGDQLLKGAAWNAVQILELLAAG
ncbi:aspartate-semialdehyde dehydrogenase [Methylacidimicrobium cyclopophantes]|uniref:Aspartate-semialdehyde dehydrogenase n=1 Tax=Methylacidimicrobium cyclopophantes TaxID=1041766 RepID=A0A5E6M6Y3_9BACT|nr:aspartate-semialdehyde dehydrogenase [Methylacidimicrobium cyclopophantes]VVM04980.1 aspartate-semialdehyde dehydrogenase [Methylacidimicrobium cyclopophantes]